jgi:hypothetical protein
MTEDEGRGEAPEDLLEELDLAGENRRTLGRPRVEFSVEYERDLSKADMAALALPRGVRPKSLVRIHASHHALARCLAAGMRSSQAALVTGYDGPRISFLQNDPTFIELVREYRDEVKSVFADLAERMNNLSLDAIELLQARLHDAPETFDAGALLDMIKVFADRTGHGPNQQVTLSVSTDAIDRPPRETYEQWQARRTVELGSEEPKKLN